MRAGCALAGRVVIVGACRAVRRRSARREPVAAGAEGGASAEPRSSSVGPTEGRRSTSSPGPATSRTASTDPAYDWITPFETRDRLHRSTVQTFGTSDEAFTQFTTNPEQFDVISASGDASRTDSFAAGFVQPVNVDLVPSYADIFDAAQGQAVQHVRRRPLRHPARPRLQPAACGEPTEVVTPGPDHTGPRCSTRPRTATRSRVYDAPIYIADAAVVLMATKPELKITNPYALDDTQFKAAVDLLKQQKPTVGEYWNDYAKQMDVVHATATRPSARPGRSSPNLAAGRTDVKVDVIKPTRARPAGRTRG